MSQEEAKLKRQVPDFQKWGSVPQTIATLIGAIIIVIGWYVTYNQSIERDILVKKREARVQALSGSLNDLGLFASTVCLDDANKLRFQKSLTTIQVYGNYREVTLAVAAAHELANTRIVHFDPLLKSLRDDLRSELGLSPITDSFSFIEIRNQPRPCD
jgi:Tfp pilus assembly protein PilO